MQSLAPDEIALYSLSGGYVTRVKIPKGSFPGIINWQGRAFTRSPAGQYQEATQFSTNEAKR